MIDFLITMKWELLQAIIKIVFFILGLGIFCLISSVLHRQLIEYYERKK